MTNKQISRYYPNKSGICPQHVFFTNAAAHESKAYNYKGFTFRKTTIMNKNMRYLYEIDGLKDCEKMPFLTTIESCKTYINDYLEDPTSIFYTF